MPPKNRRSEPKQKDKMKPIRFQLTCLVAFIFPATGFAQPIIITQPKHQSVSLGAKATFIVRASGKSPFGYQWRYNNVAIPDATGIALVLTNIQLPSAGAYTAVVTDALGLSATSQIAVLTVDPTFTKI